MTANRLYPKTLLPLAAPFVLACAAFGQCNLPQGNALLSLEGLPQPGRVLHVGLATAPYTPLALAMDTSNPAPTVVPGFGTICTSLTPVFLTGTGFEVLQSSSSLGSYSIALHVPPLASLVGTPLVFQGLALDLAAPNGSIASSNAVRTEIEPASAYQIVFADGFENPAPPPWEMWTSSGLWQVGVPSNVGPSAFAGSRCAGTDLAGNYAHNGVDAILKSPDIALPVLQPGERIVLSYKVWFSSEDTFDYLPQRIRVDPSLPTSAFVNLTGTVPMSGGSAGWVQSGADLTAHAGETVQVGFRMLSTYGGSTGTGARPGFYLDDVLIAVVPPPATGLQQHWDDADGMGIEWRADNGVWQVGAPTIGYACQPHTPTRHAGTVAGGSYPHNGCNSTLISPPFIVPSSTSPRVYYWQWLDSEQGFDYGRIFYTTDGGVTWLQLGGSVSGPLASWSFASEALVDQSGVSLAGQTIQLGFRFDSTYGGSTGTGARPGWHLDGIEVW